MDISTESYRRDLLVSAMSLGQSVLSKRFPIFLNHRSLSEGFLLIHPVYRSGQVPNTIEARIRELQYWVVIPLDAQTLFSVNSSFANLIRYRLQHEDPSGLSSGVLASHEFRERSSTIRKKQIKLLGGSYTVEWDYGSEFFKHLPNPINWTPVLSVLLTLLLSALTVTLHRLRKDADQLSQERTQELSDQTRVLQEIMDLSPVGFFLTNDQGACVYTNRKLQEILGLSFEEMLGDGWRRCLHPEDTEKLDQAWKECLTAGGFKLEYRFLNAKTGFESQVIGSARAIYGDDGKVRAFVGAIQDVTDIKAQHLKLVEATRLASVGEMAGGIAHEINNPLAIICGLAVNLLNYLQNNRTHDLELLRSRIAKIEETGMRISKIVRALKSVSRAGESDPFEWAPVADIVDAAIELCREKFRNSEVQLHIEGGMDAELNCREVQISQVLINLLNNAYDAVQNMREKWIRLDVEKSLPGGLIIRVTDSGFGIPSNIVSKIMMPFFTTKQVGKGTGLGLSISRSILEAHEARFYVDTSARNTSFVIEFPPSRVRFFAGSNSEKLSS